LITLFAGYPIISHFTEKTQSNNGAYNAGGINATGQVPFIPNFPTLIDSDTPQDKLAWTNPVGTQYTLSFSDEFNKAGRTFYPGDDPFWQAV
jgi:beta-glucanase (GH16 family)